MNSNSIIIGALPTKGGGINKTYLESKFKMVEANFLSRLYSNQKIKKTYVYMDKNENIDIYTEKFNKEDGFIEVEILSVFPLNISEYYSSHFLIEVISKEILLEHLLDERMNIERTIDNEFRRK